MNREVHVRFWEGLAVRFRWATQLLSQDRNGFSRRLAMLRRQCPNRCPMAKRIRLQTPLISREIGDPFLVPQV